MRVAVFGVHKFEERYLLEANGQKHELVFFYTTLNIDTASLAEKFTAVSIFTNDDASAPVLKKLHHLGVKAITLRSAGYNNLDLTAARDLGMRVYRVPEYSPYAIAEHTVALMLALNRKLISAHSRVRELNFSLDGLQGFDMNGKKVGIVGLGRIGKVVARILHGFGCHLMGHDLYEDIDVQKNFGLQYTTLERLISESDIITLHAPLNNQTRYLINGETIGSMKPGVMLINTSRGALVDTKEVIKALKTGHIGYFGIDVYEEEAGLFFEDHSEDILQDDVIARLMTFKNVLITSHQAFLTETALTNIATTTIHNIDCIEKNGTCMNEIKL